MNFNVEKNLVKILILTLKMCDFANKLAPTAASPVLQTPGRIFRPVL